MQKLWIFCSGIVLGVLLSAVALYIVALRMNAAEVEWPKEAPRVAGDERITELLEPLLEKHRVPAMGAAVVDSKGLRAVGVAGWRHLGNPTAVSEDDAWHIGSDTKAMTATLAALAVERGELRWDSRLAEVFPDLAPTFGAGWGEVTLQQLLTHRSGAEANLASWPSTRREVVARMATGPHPAGDVYRYSNLGYVVVGVMLEQVTGLTWERLIARDLWGPLHMQGCGFGGMGTEGKDDGLWGHDRKGKPMGNGPDADNPPIMGPAGTVHLPLKAWAAFIADQLAGARGQPGLLKPESYRHLFTPWAGGDYACGWIVVKRSWAKGEAMNHAGSNTMNYAVVWMAPGIDRAFLVTANQGDADQACDTAVEGLLKRFTP